MKYTVLWTPPAEEQLAAIWLRAEDRRQVTSAARTIDAMLREDPQERGESRSGTKRIMFAPPLGIDFNVLEDDRLVYVLGVWTIHIT
jgi:plasmid stabilization system protein ParE